MLNNEDNTYCSLWLPVEPISSMQGAVGQPDVLGVDWDDGSPGKMGNLGKSWPETAEGLGD